MLKLCNVNVYIFLKKIVIVHKAIPIPPSCTLYFVFFNVSYCLSSPLVIAWDWFQ